MITCALSSKQIEFLYSLTKQSINEKLKIDKPFIVDDYMNYLYKRISNTAGKEQASQFLAFTPTIIEQVVLNNFTENLDQIEGYDKISTLKAKWSNPNTVLKNVYNTLEQNKTNLALARKLRQEAEGVVPNDDSSKFDYNTVPRYKAINVLSTTLPAFKPGTKEFEKETADKERKNINDIISAISNNAALEDTVLNYPQYQGINIRLKATNLSGFVNGTFDPKKLDSTTQKEIARSLDIQNPNTQGAPQAGVDQIQDRVIVLITDEQGNPLSFDSNGDVVSSESPNGKYAFQLMRSIRKSGNTYSIRDIYNKKEQVLNASEIAKIRSEETGMSFEKSLDQVNLEFKEYYNLKNAALKEDITLDLIGVTEGVDISKTTKQTSVSTLIANDIIDDTVLNNIRTLTVSEGKISKGKSVIDVDGTSYQIDRARMPEDLAKQIQTVLFSTDIPFKDKVNFYKQFIPNQIYTEASSRHAITEDVIAGDIFINVYDKTVSNKKYGRNTLFEIKIDKNGKVFETRDTLYDTEVNLNKKEKYKSEFNEALSKTYPDGNSIFINYNAELLKDPFSFKSFKDGNIKSDIDYIDFIKSLDPIVYIASSEVGSYNKQMLFEKPSDLNLKDITQDLPVNERFNQLEEDEYLDDLLLETDVDNVKRLKKEYKGKLVYSTPGLYSSESFKDTVEFTDDIMVDLIPTIQFSTGDVFRAQLEDESNAEYIFAFSKTGFKKSNLDPAVKNRIKQLTNEGATVVTQTVDFINDSDLIVLGDRNNPGVQNFNLKDTFFQKELSATESYLENIKKEPLPLVVSPLENKKIVIEKATTVDTNKPSSKNLTLFRKGSLNADAVSKQDIKRATDFWNNSPLGKKLQKDISLEQATNLVNSDAFASFVISGSNLMNPNIKGTINVNNSKGTMVDVYHESFHAFTQLYLSKQEKIDLYNEVLNFTNEEGKQPYVDMSYLQIEEMLAEDFRTYMKKEYVKKNSPKRNNLFRKILNLLKTLFGKFKPNRKDVQIDAMSVPAVNELFENLNFGKDEFLNKYSASIDNAMFSELDRGVQFVDKINKENVKRTALSTQDSDLVSGSIDSIISNIIDDEYKARLKDYKGDDLVGYTSKLQGLNLSALLEDENRAQLYSIVKDKLEIRLGELNKDFTDSTETSSITEFKTFEDLKDSSVAVLKTKSGINKYVLLKSQIDNFKEFNSDFKAGDRVKGEEWKGIKIVGDYFTHSTIKDTSGEVDVPAQIIVVSRASDAKIQYDNYIKGNAKEYTGFEAKTDIEDSTLTQKQENLLDNIRILQTAIDQFGDPNYVINGTKPTGVIAYHINHSSFEIKKINYLSEDVVNEEEVNEEGVPAETAESLDPDFNNFKKSLYDLASKEVIFILKSLNKIENGKTVNNKLGFKETADFRKVWNTLSKTIGGVQSREEMYNIIKEEAKNFPELEQLINYKLPSPNGITSTYAFDISSSFWHTFSRPSVKFWQLTAASDPNVQGGGDFVFTTNESTISLNRILLNFESRFKVSKNNYMLRPVDQEPQLNIQKVYNDFIKPSGTLSPGNRLQFLNVLGFKLDNTKKLIEALNTKDSSSDINNLVTLIKNINSILIKPSTEQTTVERKFITTFSRNPVGSLRNDKLIEANIDLLPSFKNTSTLRANSIVTNLGNIQSSFGFDTPGDSIKLPDGNTAQSVANHSSTASLLNGINSLSNLEDAYVPNGPLSFLNPHLGNTIKGMPFNPLAGRSKILNTLFPNGNKRDTTKELEYVLLAGTEVRIDQGNVGINTGDLISSDKLFQSFNMLLSEGVGEFIRHADKKSAFGIKMQKRKEFNNVKTGTDKNLWIDIDMFEDNKGDRVALNAFIVDYIASEFDRIQYFEKNPSVLKETKGYNRIVNGKEVGLQFMAMDSLIDSSVKEELYKRAKDFSITNISDIILNDTELYGKIQKNVSDYFNAKSEFIENALGSSMNLNSEFKKYDSKTLAKAYTYNDFINKLEMSNLVNGDVAQFKDFTKRAPGSTSDGNGFLYDIGSQDFINNVFQDKTYAETQEIDNFKFDGTLNTGVIADPKRSSVYLKEMQAAWTESYENTGLYTKADILKRVKLDSAPYEKMEEADGAAYLTFDAYRVLKKLGNKWSTEQENLYNDIVAGKPIDPNKVSKFFPVYKLHYYGPLMNNGIATTAMYKFAVAPIIPSIAKPGTELYNLHLKMLQLDRQMVTFSSGSKAAYLTTDGSADNIFRKENDSYFKDKYVEIDNTKAPIANNKIHLSYLKDVTEVADKLKNQITLPTQSRVVTISQLYDMGILKKGIDPKVAKEYVDAVNNHTDVLETQLLDEIGFEKVNGKYVSYGKNGLERLARLVRTELDSKGSPIQLQNIIDVRPSGELKMDFSIHPEAQIIEQILINRISKALSSQKVKGESDVQVPSTFYNGVWSTEFEKELALKKNDQLIKEKLGTNNLPFYRRGAIDPKTGKRLKTDLAKVAIPFNGDFVNLLNLDYNNEPIETLDRLNKAIKDTDWLKENSDKVTITGPRIPTDDTNLIEAFEVWHFIGASAGSTVIVPTEIVAKAGSDFDVDKLFFAFPSINANGSLVEEIPNFKSEVSRLRKEKKSIAKIVAQQKAFAQNELIRTSVDILRLPENYAGLTKPSSTYLMKDQATVDSKTYDKVHSSISENPSKFFEAEYDIKQHELLMGGSIPLGILAKKNKQHILNKSVGAKMPKVFFEKDVLPRKMKIRFPYNKTSEGNISISTVNNVDGVSISEIFSHGLQGVLDRANDPFPVQAGITKESLSVMNRLIESGVSLPQVVAFIKQPIIQDYFKNLASSKGTVAELNLELGESTSSKAEVVDDLISNRVNEYPEAIKYYNNKSIEDAFVALKNSNNVESIEVSISYVNRLFKFENLKEFEEFSKKEKLTKTKIERINLNGKNIFSKLYKKSKNPYLYYRSYHLGEYFWNKAYGKGKFPTTESLKKDSSEVKALALMFDFLNIERQSSGMENFEINFNPDTGILDTYSSVIDRKAFIDGIKLDSKVDLKTIENYVDNSVISSMYKTNIFKDIVEPAFTLRLNPELQKVETDLYKKNSVKAQTRFGKGIEGRDAFTKAFNNGVIDYIYQNVMSNYTDSKGLPVSLPETIRGRQVNVKELANNVVKFKETSVDIDLKQIKADYKNNIFQDLGSTLDTFENSPFSTEDSYLRYVIEREYFRETYKEFKDDAQFEQKISKRALATSFNRGYIMGDAGFGPIKYSYTKDVLEFINDPKNVDIVENYPVLQHLTPSYFLASKGFNLLDLDNKKLIDNDTALDYYKQLKQLGDITVNKTIDKENKNRNISDLFKNFSLIAMYQQGTGKSGLNFIKALDPNDFVDILAEPTINFQNALFGKDRSKMSMKEFQAASAQVDNVFNTVTQSILDTNDYKNLLVSPSEFLKGAESTPVESSLDLISEDVLYSRYKDALENEELDNADPGFGTARVLKLQNELEKRGLLLDPSITDTTTEQTGEVDYNFNRSNVSEEEREKGKKFVLDQLGNPLSIEFESRGEDSLYKFTFKDGTYIETSGKGSALSLPKGVSKKIVELSKTDSTYDIKFLLGLNKLAEEQQPQPTAEVELPIGTEVRVENEEGTWFISKYVDLTYLGTERIDKGAIVTKNLGDNTEMLEVILKDVTPATQPIQTSEVINTPSLFEIDPALQSFYNNLTKEQLDNPKMPSMDEAQDFYTNMSHGYNNINEYIEELKCI
tara:strand:- start:4988 stop:16087 length:11100 start_codon:yes stop_codon:yes gene_type:complete